MEGIAAATTDAHELVARHQRGDGEAFAELIRLFRAPVHNYFFRCGLDAATRDDLLQETFLKIHAGAASYSPDRPLKVWVFTIAANTARSHFRKLQTRDRVIAPIAVDVAPDAASDEPSSQEHLEAREAAAWLADAIGNLPVEQREIIVLSCIERIEHKEIAEILGMPQNSVKTHLRRARLSLAKELCRRRARARREVSP